MPEFIFMDYYDVKNRKLTDFKPNVTGD